MRNILLPSEVAPITDQSAIAADIGTTPTQASAGNCCVAFFNISDDLRFSTKTKMCTLWSKICWIFHRVGNCKWCFAHETSSAMAYHSALPCFLAAVLPRLISSQHFHSGRSICEASEMNHHGYCLPDVTLPSRESEKLCRDAKPLAWLLTLLATSCVVSYRPSTAKQSTVSQ